MKLVTYAKAGLTQVGWVDGDEVAAIDIPDMRALFALEGNVSANALRLSTGVRHRLDEVALRAPIVPKKIFHTAGNYAEHAQEGDRANWVAAIRPWIMFFQNPDAIIGPDDPIVYPEHLTRELDYELELAVIISKPGRFLSVEQAKDCIGGYVIFNDITARDIQRREMQSANFVFSKSISSFCPFGPWIVTADEIDDPYDLDLELTVNGEKRQISNTSHMSVTIPQIISKFSPAGYSAGDIVTTGTVSGVAAFSKDPQAWYLKPGDRIEAKIERIGVLRNEVVSWKQAYGVEAPQWEGF
ncbi:fumarylacetoacetate hydrolase family protein [Thiomonas sp.]|jgi:2-keto-4-pentenoate hydratase/2-oxohepta-3-ene-1,7-dioic acid hydratase in catechol pathway|uniref:fumarylacetoacetate hydrolase family protein n=1 Tax=Thiomonas sp. TaxID=2047785 RepID=UPI00261F07AA|nr:fumarylacetoacetate hydrolase family protein [Thiomonas sp.]